MVSLCMELVSSHRLSIQTTFVSGTVWLQFAMQVMTGGCHPRPPVWGRGGHMGSEMGPHITIGLSVTVLAVLRMFQSLDRQTNGQTHWSSSRRHRTALLYELNCIGHQKQESCAIAKMTAQCPHATYTWMP